jgi:hypothetical protein
MSPIFGLLDMSLPKAKMWTKIFSVLFSGVMNPYPLSSSHNSSFPFNRVIAKINPLFYWSELKTLTRRGNTILILGIFRFRDGEI